MDGSPVEPTRDAGPGTGGPTLRSRSASGVRWTAVSSFAITALQVLQLAVIARFLGAEDFGIVSMALVVIGFALAYADMGLGKSIIHRQDTTPEQLSSLYWVNVASGFAVAATILLASPLLVRLFDEPRLLPLRWLSALVFVVTPFGQQFQFLLQRDLRFRELALAEVGGSFAGAVVAIGTAWAGAGVYALIWGTLASALVRTLALASIGMREWRPRLRLRVSEIRGHLGFGGYQMGERTVGQVTSSADVVIIGRILGPEALGIYNLASQLVQVPVRKINPILTRVAFPVFAKAQHDDGRLQSGYLEMSRLLAGVSFPLLAGIAVLAPIAVPLLFGPGWEATVPVIQVLAIVGAFRTLANPMGAILLAKGRADVGFAWNLVTAVANVAVFLVAVRYGLTVFAWSMVGLGVAYFVAGRLIIERMIELSPIRYVRALSRTVLAAAAMGGVVLLARVAATGHLPPLVLLAGLVALGVAVYAALLLWLEPAFVKRTWETVVPRRGGQGRPATARAPPGR